MERSGFAVDAARHNARRSQSLRYPFRLFLRRVLRLRDSIPVSYTRTGKLHRPGCRTAVLAREPRLLRQEDCPHRFRRHRDYHAPGAGREGGTCHNDPEISELRFAHSEGQNHGQDWPLPAAQARV